MLHILLDELILYRLLIASILFQHLTDILQRVFIAGHLITPLLMVHSSMVYLFLSLHTQAVAHLI